METLGISAVHRKSKSASSPRTLAYWEAHVSVSMDEHVSALRGLDTFPVANSPKKELPSGYHAEAYGLFFRTIIIIHAAHVLWSRCLRLLRRRRWRYGWQHMVQDRRYIRSREWREVHVVSGLDVRYTAEQGTESRFVMLTQQQTAKWVQ